MLNKRLLSLITYIPVIALWSLIFYNNLFSRLFFVDYSPPAFLDISKSIMIGSLQYNSYLLDIIKLMLYPFNAIHLTFQLSMLLAMLICHHYSKKLLQHNIHSILFTTMYIFNPFVYSRIMSGQIGVLISYLLMPVYMFYLFEIFKKNLRIKQVAKAAFALTITSSLSAQFFAFNILLFFLAFFWFYMHKNKNRSAKTILKCIATFLILAAILNLPFIIGIAQTKIFSEIDYTHESFFSPKLSENLPAIAKIVSMHGFWRENSYTTTYKELPLPLWYIMLFAMLFLMIAGYHFSSHDNKSKFFYTLFWIGIIFGTGISHPYTKPFFNFLFNNLPFFNGFRDSHKFVAFIALSYAYLTPLATIKLRDSLKNAFAKRLAIILFIIFIVFYTYPLIGLSSQVKNVDYPKEYLALDGFLSSQSMTGSIIYLPWQTYLTYNWTLHSSSDGRISNPINKVSKNIILDGQDIFGSPGSIRPEIKSCLDMKNLSCLKSLDIQYIIHDSCAFYPDDYSWINSTLLHKDGCLAVYSIAS